MSVENEVRVLTHGTVWIAREPQADEDLTFWCDGAAAAVEVENTDVDEIAIHVLLDKSDDPSSEDVSFYMTRHEASRLMAALGRAVLR